MRGSNSGRVKKFSLLQIAQSDSEAHQASYSMGTAGKTVGAWSQQLISI